MSEQPTRAQRNANAACAAADVTHFFDAPTNTLSYVVRDPAGSACAIVDSVLNLDYPSGTITYESADAIVEHVRREKLEVEWILETHVHADHLSAAPYLQERLGGRIAIGSHITTVQDAFGRIFNAGEGFARDGSQFDTLLDDGDEIRLGTLEGHAMHTPGHTPACMTYVIGDAIFVGDTLFMPDYGTARCDFPGGDAGTLYRSVRRILELPASSRIFVCHDYMPGGRAMAFETTVGEERAKNIHVHDGVSEEEFVAMRTTRDATLGMPTLILPSLQVNMRAGHLPPRDGDDRLFLKIPLNAFGGPDVSALAAKE